MIKQFKFFEGIGLYRILPSGHYDNGFRFLTGESDEIRITFNHEIVRDRTRRLRVTWIPELTEDLNAYHGIDAEAELTRILNEEISASVASEIDNDILGRLLEMVNEENETNNFENNVIPMTISDRINLEDETDEEVIRGINTLNGDYYSNEENDEVIDEIIRRINGGNRA